jgi:hypothetical protein
VAEHWAPCRLGHPEPEHCPNCTPPESKRCGEALEHWTGWPGNGPEPMWLIRRPCRVLGRHSRHNDGMGTTWTIEPPSRAASAQYDVICPTCGAFPRDPCRTLTTGRVTDTHAARMTPAPTTRVAPVRAQLAARRDEEA